MIKNRFKPIVAGIAAATTLIAVAGCSSGGEGNQNDQSDAITLVFTSFQSADAPFNAAATWVLDELEARTDGRITVERHFNSVLLSGTDDKVGIADGRADLGTVTYAYNPTEFPLASVADVPIWTGNVPSMTATLNWAAEEFPAFDEEFASKGLRVLSHGGVSEALIAATMQPTGVDWLEGKDLRAVGVPLLAVSAQGANTLPIPLIEAYEAIERGIIDGTVAGVDILVPLGVHEVVKYWAEAGIGSSGPIEFVISESTWESLSPSDQELLSQLASEYPDKLTEETIASQEAACEAIAAEGGEVSRWADAEIAKLRAGFGSGPAETWVDKARAAGLEEPETVLAAVEAKFQEQLEVFPDYPGTAELCNRR